MKKKRSSPRIRVLKLPKKYYLIIPLSFFSVILLYIFVIMQPRNDRDWDVGFEILPHIEMHGYTIDVTHVRDYRFEPNKLVSKAYTNRTLDLTKLERVWFVTEPFNGFHVIKFDGIAHTYFVFDFQDQKPLVVSVEARREKGEKFDLFPGLFNQFELMYVWGIEEDITVQRVLVQHNKLYMYPLTISKNSAQQLFLQLAKTTSQLETHPRFYNSLTSNCTNELAKNANNIKPGTIPFNLNWFLPGHAVAELYKLGFIPNNKPLEEITQKYYISDLVKKNAGKDDFSNLLRRDLLK